MQICRDSGNDHSFDGDDDDIDIALHLVTIVFQFQAALLQRWNLPSFLCPFCPFFQVFIKYFVRKVNTKNV